MFEDLIDINDTIGTISEKEEKERIFREYGDWIRDQFEEVLKKAGDDIDGLFLDELKKTIKEEKEMIKDILDLPRRNPRR